MTLVKIVKQTLFRTITIRVGTTPVGFCSKRERFDSTPNTTNKRRNCRQGTGEGVWRDIIRWKTIKRKH